MKTYPSSSSDLPTLLRVAYLHFEGRSQQEIATQLDVSRSTVSRLIARAKNYVELRYRIPGNIELEAQILRIYRHLNDVRVVETGTVDQETEVVGQEAANYFLENVFDGAHVALSCGETLLEMLKELPNQRNITLTISQMSAEGDPETIHQAPAALVGQLRAKVGPSSTAFGLQLPPFSADSPEDLAYRKFLRNSSLLNKLKKKCLKADFAFIGVGGVRKYRASGGHSFLRSASAATNGKFDELVPLLGIVGEINNRPFDSKGRDQTKKIPGLSNNFMTILDLNDIRSMAADSETCKVVAVATGSAKLEPIRVALRTGLCNVLITGADLARALIEADSTATQALPTDKPN